VRPGSDGRQISEGPCRATSALPSIGRLAAVAVALASPSALGAPGDLLPDGCAIGSPAAHIRATHYACLLDPVNVPERQLALAHADMWSRAAVNDRAQDCSKAWGALSSAIRSGVGPWPRLGQRPESDLRDLAALEAGFDGDALAAMFKPRDIAYNLGSYFVHEGLARLARGERSEAALLQDAYARLARPRWLSDGSREARMRARSAAIRAFALAGGDITCGIPLPSPRSGAGVETGGTSPVSATEWPVLVNEPAAGQPDSQASRFVASARAALSLYATTCSLGLPWYEIGYSYCPITDLQIDDGGARAALDAARDLGLPRLAAPNARPDVMWWGALLAANAHDPVGSVALLDELARTASSEPEARRVAEARDWIVTAGGLDCHLPFVARSPLLGAP